MSKPVSSTTRTLVIDNYDSFTYNLSQLIGALGQDVVVVRNDAIALGDIDMLAPTHIVLSPGPGHPRETRDFGICGTVVQHYGPTTPILGVCLGHQGIVHYLGGEIVRAPVIMHGKQSRVVHDGSGIFMGIPSTIDVMRYHSLVADRQMLPSCLRVIAETDAEGTVMAVAHTHWLMTGVQFHPESIGTPYGRHLMANFLGVAA